MTVWSRGSSGWMEMLIRSLRWQQGSQFREPWPSQCLDVAFFEGGWWWKWGMMNEGMKGWKDHLLMRKKAEPDKKAAVFYSEYEVLFWLWRDTQLNCKWSDGWRLESLGVSTNRTACTPNRFCTWSHTHKFMIIPIRYGIYYQPPTTSHHSVWLSLVHTTHNTHPPHLHSTSQVESLTKEEDEQANRRTGRLVDCRWAESDPSSFAIFARFCLQRIAAFLLPARPPKAIYQKAFPDGLWSSHVWDFLSHLQAVSGRFKSLRLSFRCPVMMDSLL